MDVEMDVETIFPYHGPFSPKQFHPPHFVVQKYHMDISDLDWSET
jgi:hypothetical protein